MRECLLPRLSVTTKSILIKFGMKSADDDEEWIRGMKVAYLLFQDLNYLHSKFLQNVFSNYLRPFTDP